MVTLRQDGSCDFCLFMPHAQDVQLVADFTGWRRGVMRLRTAGDGWWRLHARIPAGDHLFNYLVDDDVWLPDYAAHGLQQNPWGGWVSMLASPGCADVGPPTARRERAGRTRRAARRRGRRAAAPSAKPALAG